ncbi:MAG: hypothetical protein ACO1RA_13280 [Planctomycetaceae bacterium]
MLASTLKFAFLLAAVFAVAFLIGQSTSPSRQKANRFGLAFAAEEKTTSSTDKQNLAPLQGVVGNWRGVGQPQRGSTKGSWVEKADWAWDFSGKHPALIGKLTDGKHLQSLKLLATADRKAFQLELIGTDEKPLGPAWTGTLAEDGSVTFAPEKASNGELARVTLRQVAGGDRMLLLLEKKATSGNGFARLAEVGYTRQGSGFGQGAQGRECIVTGGAGTMEVTFMGKTYAVCCTGCRDYFNDNPEKTLAEYRERKEQEKAAKK